MSRKKDIYRSVFCLHCSAPIRQTGRGRARKFCENNVCKAAWNREHRRQEHERTKDSLLRHLQSTRWAQFDKPTTVFTLEQIVKGYGVGAASLATEAIEQELRARAENPSRHTLSGSFVSP